MTRRLRLGGLPCLLLATGACTLGPDYERAFHDFERAVGREIGRARRHDRSFVLLSIARDEKSAIRRVDALGAGRVADRITEARELLEEALSGLTGVPAGAEAALNGDGGADTTTTAPPDG